MLCRALFLAAVAVIAVSAHENATDFGGRIIGGAEAAKKDARYLAQIFELQSYNHGQRQVKFVGTGAFISSRTIVTAASILERGKKYVVRYGSNNIVYSGHAEIEIVNIFVPPNHDSQRRVNNIALLILARPVTECSACRDIEYLQIQSTSGFDQNGVHETVGFGYADHPCYRGNRRSTVLRKTGMTILSSHLCKKITNYGDNGRLICTRPDNYISTVCSGDEGAPLVDTTYKVLVGVMNYGDDYCDIGAPVVYTATLPFTNWIRSKIVY